SPANPRPAGYLNGSSLIPRDLANDFMAHGGDLLRGHAREDTLPGRGRGVVGLGRPNLAGVEITEGHLRVDIRITRHHAEHDACARRDVAIVRDVDHDQSSGRTGRPRLALLHREQGPRGGKFLRALLAPY